MTDQPSLFTADRLAELTEQREQAHQRWQQCYRNCLGAARALGYAEATGLPEAFEVRTRREAWARYSDELDQIQAELRDLSRQIADLITST